MACHVNLVPQSMATASAKPKAPPPPAACSISKPFISAKLVHSSQSSFVSTFSPSRPQTLTPLRSSRAMTDLYDLVHVAAGDLLRAEIASGSENGKRARAYMDKGQLVPDEIVVMMVKERLLQPDSQEKGWLLDGYPRSSSQAIALKEFGFEPDLFILLDVPEEILVDRVVGRRLDPVTGKIYHLKYSPPETPEIAARLTQRFDDTEEKVKLRLHTHHQNVEAVLSLYEDITLKVDGSVTKDDVFAQIDGALAKLLEKKRATTESLAA
ncbi:adenylate kinase, chloroplastic isoform X2 [Rosa chinensis]|uniref:adenylate kinase, chloroplastic isoform X2 n=1 Tax=Rosa chinensis TaxID=74649 RepID=UPI001AD928E9|nr:adenylate kinase, chloroplastic isoform X2 [Rosa chinensis]